MPSRFEPLIVSGIRPPVLPIISFVSAVSYAAASSHVLPASVSLSVRPIVGSSATIAASCMRSLLPFHTMPARHA